VALDEAGCLQRVDVVGGGAGHGVQDVCECADAGRTSECSQDLGALDAEQSFQGGCGRVRYACEHRTHGIGHVSEDVVGPKEPLLASLSTSGVTTTPLSEERIGRHRGCL
jgi:hypothetical protein